jgi:flagellar biosynthetic protein FlhB
MAGNGEKTEKPTSRRRERAREEGRYAQSQELTSALTLAVVLTTLSYTLGAGGTFRTFLSGMLDLGIKGPASVETFSQMIRKAGTFFLMTSAPVLAAGLIASLTSSVLQGYSTIGAGPTGLKWEQLNPINGLSKLKSKVSLMEWVKTLTLVAIAFFALWSTMSEYWQQLVTLPAHDIHDSTLILRTIVTRLASYIVGAAFVIAVGDFFIQRFKFEKSLKQTKAEVKEDMKSADGNPAVKNKIRQIQRQFSRRRMMARIKDADVIVTNPTHYAVALEYKPGKNAAPRVVAKGMDWLAQKIKEEGRNYDIPTVENVPLARALYRSVELEQEIPLDLYKAVAEVLAYVFKIRKRM